MTATSAKPTDAQRAGRGFLFITGAKLYFILAGAVIEFLLPHLFPAAARGAMFGLYKVTVGVISIVNNVIVTVTIQSVSKFVAEDEAREGQVARAGWRLMLPIGLAAAAGFALLAPFIAGFENDSSLVPYLRIAAIIPFGYAMYSVLVGVANGRREFHKQAGLDCTFSTTRAVLVLGLAAAGFGVGGAIAGFAAASIAIIAVAALVVRPHAATGERFPASRLGAFFGQVGLYTLLLNLLLQVSLLLLKRYTHSHPELAGYYGAANALGQLSYTAIIAVIFVIFPLVSRATFEGDADKARAYVGTAMRYSFMLAALFGVVLIAKPADLIRVPYPDEFAAAGSALQALGIGFVAFAMIAVSGAILNGAGRTTAALVTVGATLALAAAANAVLVPSADDPMRTAAWATTGAMAAGLLLTGGVLLRDFRSFLPPATAVRVAIAMAAGVAVGHLLPSWQKLVELGLSRKLFLKLAICAELGVVAVVYLIALVATREITGADLARVRRRGK